MIKTESQRKTLPLSQRLAGHLLLIIGGTSVAIFFAWTPEFNLVDALRAPQLSLADPKWLLGGDAFGRPLILLVPMAAAGSLGLGAFAATSTALLSLLFSTLILLAIDHAQTQNTRLTRWIASSAQRTIDFFLAFPSLLFSLAFASILGPGWLTLMMALWVGHLPGLIRLLVLRGQEVRRQEFWLCSEALGAGLFLRAFRHLTPALLELVFLKFPSLFASSLIAEATLSFLGMGAPIGRATWGSLLAQGKDYLVEAPNIALATGIPLILTLWALMQNQWIESARKGR
jgi:peptide/nickel transport system permease protein